MTREPREGGRGWAMSGLGSQGDAADFMREVFFARWFFPLFFFFFFFFSQGRKRIELPCRFGASRFCHTRVTFGDVNFSPDSFSFRSTY